MNTQTITERLLLSASSSKNSVRVLLLAFGVTNPTRVTLPVVFNPKYEAEWRTFVEQSDFAAPDHETRLLYTILEFIRYMRYNKRNPFLRAVIDPVTRGALKPDVIYKRLVKEQLSSRLAEIDRSTKKYGLLNFLDIKESSVFASLDKDAFRIVSYSVLKPRRSRDTLDSVLAKLRGTLYSDDIPIQLLDRFKGKGSKRSALPRSRDLQSADVSNLGWFLLGNTNGTTLALRRASDNSLVFRSISRIKVYVELGNKVESEKFVAKTWKALKKQDIL